MLGIVDTDLRPTRSTNKKKSRCITLVPRVEKLIWEIGTPIREAAPT